MSGYGENNMLQKPPTGMIEMYTTPRKKEMDVVKEILRENKIKYKSREEHREIGGWRYCLYVPHQSSKRAYKAIEEGLLERDM